MHDLADQAYARLKQDPRHQAATFDLIINLEAAKALGLTIPPRVLVRATEVIQ